MNKEIMKSLPDKPSELLRVALTDYFSIKQDLRYKINLKIWHSPENGHLSICQVCLAGSLMAKTLKVSIGDTLRPSEFNSDIQSKLLAINDFRRGNISLALKKLKILNLNLNVSADELGYIEEDIFIEFNKNIVNYKKPELFEAYIQDLIGILEAEGL